MSQEISYKKILKIALAGLVIAIVAAEFYIYFHNKIIDSKIVITEFAGIVKGVEGNTISVIGAYKTDIEGVPRMPFEADILVDADTKIIKTLLFMPPYEEIKKNGGRVDWSKVRKEERVVSFDEFKNETIANDMGILVEASSNIHRDTSFTATTIRYETTEF